MASNSSIGMGLKLRTRVAATMPTKANVNITKNKIIFDAL